ncbi:capsule assembly Wzi family protein [Spirosoma luteolum]
MSQAELGYWGSSTPETPFWFQTNQYGTVPTQSATGWLRAATTIGYRSDSATARRPRTDWGGGLELIGQVGRQQQVLLTEAYLKGKLGVFELFAGRRKQVLGLAESPLSMGSFSWSRNAQPMPRVQISIPVFTPLGFTRQFVALKAYFSHGWFGQQTYVKGSFLHQKGIAIRLGKPTARFHVMGAFDHQVQWSGYAPFLETDPNTAFHGQLATSWEAFYNVVVPAKTDALKNLSKFTTYDQNRVGDHRGTAELAIALNLPATTVTFYQQHFYDIGRKLYNFRNIEDGLYGLRLMSKKRYARVQDAVVEVFNTQSQGYIHFGRTLGGEPENYYINGQYPDGWSYRGRTIGNPFISQTASTNPALGGQPFYGDKADGTRISGLYGINNNRLLAFNGAIMGYLPTQSRNGVVRYWQYRLQASYSQNFGLFSRPFPGGINQFSALASLSKPVRWLGGADISASVGYDAGQLLRYPDQAGYYIGLRKQWLTTMVTRSRTTPARPVKQS